jgi:hypothetical protein
VRNCAPRISRFRVWCFAPSRNDDGEIARVSLALPNLRAIYRPQMVLNRTSMVCRRVVIDDRCRLPGRFFGRFATSATSELSAAL